MGTYLDGPALPMLGTLSSRGLGEGTESCTPKLYWGELSRGLLPGG